MIHELPPPEPLPTGTLLGDHEIVRMLSHGSFGLTYLAREKPRGVQRAVKEFFPAKFVSRPDGLTVTPRVDADREMLIKCLDAFLDEGRILQSLNHPNIVTVRDTLEAHETAYLVMDYLDGNTLKARLKEPDGPLHPEEAVRLGAGLAEALDAMHEHGIIHRDIKPDNVMIRPDGTPVLIDFGAALVVGRGPDTAGLAFVTEGYSAPEQYAAEVVQSSSSDVYSLAALIFRAIVGETPPSAPERLDGVELPKAHVFDTYRELLRVVERGLSLDISERPASATSFARALVASLPETAPPDGVESVEDDTFLDLPLARPKAKSRAMPKHRPVIVVLATVAILALLAALAMPI